MSRRSIRLARCLTAALGALLVAVGLWQGQYSAVLEKAVRICLECIGIG